MFGSENWPPGWSTQPGASPEATSFQSPGTAGDPGLKTFIGPQVPALPQGLMFHYGTKSPEGRAPLGPLFGPPSTPPPEAAADDEEMEDDPVQVLAQHGGAGMFDAALSHNNALFEDEGDAAPQAPASDTPAVAALKHEVQQLKEVVASKDEQLVQAITALDSKDRQLAAGEGVARRLAESEELVRKQSQQLEMQANSLGQLRLLVQQMPQSQLPLQVAAPADLPETSAGPAVATFSSPAPTVAPRSPAPPPLGTGLAAVPVSPPAVSPVRPAPWRGANASQAAAPLSPSEIGKRKAALEQLAVVAAQARNNKRSPGTASRACEDDPASKRRDSGVPAPAQ